MSRYELLLVLHVIGVIIWLGAGFLIAVLVFGAERSGDRLKEAGHHRDVAWLAPRLFIPASLSALILGILLVVDGPWAFGDLWVVLGLAGWAVSFGLGFFYFRPEGERIGALVERHGPAFPEVEQRIARLNVVDRLQVLILFLVVVAMIAKPTGDDVALLVVLGAMLAGASALVVLSMQRQAARRSGDTPPQTS